MAPWPTEYMLSRSGGPRWSSSTGAPHILFALTAAAQVTELAVALALARGLLSGYSYALWQTLLMSVVPPDRLARVLSVDTFGVSLLMPAGFIMVGFIGAGVAPYVMIVTGQLIGAALMFGLLVVPGVRKAETSRGLPA